LERKEAKHKVFEDRLSGKERIVVAADKEQKLAVCLES